MKKTVFKNIVLFYFGFSTYITLEVCFRGYSSWLMGICGGLAVVILDKLNSRISWDMDILLQGCMGSVLITGMELVIGECMLAGLVPKIWDYSNMWLNYKGIICLPYSLIWIGLSIVAIIFADLINYYVFCEQPCPYYRLFGKIIFKLKEK